VRRSQIKNQLRKLNLNKTMFKLKLRKNNKEVEAKPEEKIEEVPVTIDVE
jgi:hypothetical protein